MIEPADLSAFPQWQKLVRTNKHYRKAWREGRFPPQVVRGAVMAAAVRMRPKRGELGPGDHLHRLIYILTGEVPDRRCPCKDRMRQMNRWGVNGCESRIEEIAAWLHAEAVTRGWKLRLPGAGWFASRAPEGVKRWTCRALVRLAIRRARKGKGGAV